MEKNKSEVAAIIVESNFLKDLRELCTKENIVLIFDEVMTGFRVSLGGAQGLFGINPDLTTLGKIIGGGLPRKTGFTGWCLRRKERNYANGSPERTNVSSRNAFRNSACDGGRI